MPLIALHPAKKAESILLSAFSLSCQDAVGVLGAAEGVGVALAELILGEEEDLLTGVFQDGAARGKLILVAVGEHAILREALRGAEGEVDGDTREGVGGGVADGAHITLEIISAREEAGNVVMCREQQALYRIGEELDVTVLCEQGDDIHTGGGAVDKDGHAVLQEGLGLFRQLLFFGGAEETALGDRGEGVLGDLDRPAAVALQQAVLLEDPQIPPHRHIADIQGLGQIGDRGALAAFQNRKDGFVAFVLHERSPCLRMFNF